MNPRLLSSLAAGLAVSSVSFAGVASATPSAHPAKANGAAKSKACKKQGKSYKAQGTFIDGELTRVAGGATPKRSDDRYSGSIIVDVTHGNRRGERDLGLRTYAVTGVRAFGITSDGELPAADASVELAGKLKAPCSAVAARSAADGDDEPVDAEAREDDVTTEDAENEDDTPSGDDRTRDRDRTRSGDDDTAQSDDDDATDEDADSPQAVTDVTLRLVRFRAG